MPSPVHVEPPMQALSVTSPRRRVKWPTCGAVSDATELDLGWRIIPIVRPSNVAAIEVEKTSPGFMLASSRKAS